MSIPIQCVNITFILIEIGYLCNNEVCRHLFEYTA